MKNFSKKIAAGAIAINLLTGAVASNAPVITNNFTAVAAISVEEALSTRSVPFVAHVQSEGWQVTQYTNGFFFTEVNAYEYHPETMIGTTHKSKRLEAFIIGDPKLSYRVQYANRNDWDRWVKGTSAPASPYHPYDFSRGIPYNLMDSVAGTTGQAKAIQAIQIKYNVEKPGYDVFYQVHIQGRGWLNWAKNGETTGNSYGARIEAIRIRLVNVNECKSPSESEDGNRLAFYSRK